MRVHRSISFSIKVVPAVREAENEKPLWCCHPPHFVKRNRGEKGDDDMHAPIWLQLDSEIMWSSHKIVQ
jgi:hypothetical protein